MRRAMRFLPAYAGDVSGACSALFELGGMVVIHDPSGCNSTYNTHDETRWYEQDSLIFITGLTERQAILGQDDRLIEDVVETATELRPRFIALANSPVPFIAGTDFRAISKAIERRCSIPCFYVPTNGMHDYVVGGSAAFAEVARRLVRACPSVPHGANVLGLTPLDFACGPSPDDVRAFVSGAGLALVSSWSMGSSLDEIERASAAEVNLVVSASGLAAARVLEERFGIPYVVGLPLEGFEEDLARALADAVVTRRSRVLCQELRTRPADGSTCIVGEPVWAASCACVRERCGLGSSRLIVPVEADRALLADTDVRCEGEEDIELALADALVVVADPLYGPALPHGARLEPHPHFAFSGRAALRQA